MNDDPIEQLIETHQLSDHDAREVRAFQDFLRAYGPPGQVTLVDHWMLSYMHGGPTPPRRWEGDDS